MVDAVRQLGVHDIEMPCSPMRVWQAIHSGPREVPDDSVDVRLRRARPPSTRRWRRSREGGEDAKVIAGGQSLMPVLRLRLAAPTALVDLGRIDELRGVREDGDTLVIGAMTTYYDVVRNPLVSEHALLLAEATATVADPQIRHRGTLGGALAHADPAGDLCAPALALTPR